MPRISNRRSLRAALGRRRRSRKSSRSSRPTKSLGRLGKMSDTYHFKGIVNAGIISWIAGSATATTLDQVSGVYVFRLSDLPIIEQFGAGFEFVRINRCRMVFMPRYNMNTMLSTILQTTDVITQPVNDASIPTSSLKLPTFITAHDEVPLIGVASTGDLAVSGTWSSQGGDDSGVTETTAYGAQGGITPSYIRGIQNSKETEIYKKHVVSFIPAFYDFASGGQGSFLNTGTFERRVKKWINCSLGLQNNTGIDGVNLPVSVDSRSAGPNFYGPVYSFSQPGINTTTSAALQLYDVKMHYSVSFKRVRGF